MKESEQLLAQGLPVLNECLKAKGQHPIEADTSVANEKASGLSGKAST